MATETEEWHFHFNVLPFELPHVQEQRHRHRERACGHSRGRRRRTNWESSSDICTLPCWVASDSLRPRSAARQAPLSMGFSKQEYWSGLPFLSPGDLPNPGTEPRSPALQSDSLPSEPPGTPIYCCRCCCYVASVMSDSV